MKKLAVKIAAALLVAAVVLAGGSSLYENVYCAGWSQGAVDQLTEFIGPPPSDWSMQPVKDLCSAAPNNPVNSIAPRFTTGNLLDKVVANIKELLP